MFTRGDWCGLISHFMPSIKRGTLTRNGVFGRQLEMRGRNVDRFEEARFLHANAIVVGVATFSTSPVAVNLPVASFTSKITMVSLA
jgi:hypothetical protein